LYKTISKKETLFELWVEKGKLVRVVIKNKHYQTKHGVGVGSLLADVYGLYRNVAHLRGDNKEWIVSVGPLNTHFYLDNTTAETFKDLDQVTRITKLETTFSCNEKAEQKAQPKEKPAPEKQPETK